MRRMRKAAAVTPAGRLLGYCQGCQCSVRTTDEWRRVHGGVAHRECECAEYVSRGTS